MTMTDTERRRLAAAAREQTFRDVLARFESDPDAAGFWRWLRRQAGDGMPIMRPVSSRSRWGMPHAAACRCGDCAPPEPPTPSAAILDLQMRVEALERLAKPL